MFNSAAQVHRRNRRRLLFTGLVGCITLLTLTWRVVHHGNAHGFIQGQPAAPVLFRLTITGQNWYGKPILQLRNISGLTLHEVSVQSWSNEYLPQFQSAPASDGKTTISATPSKSPVLLLPSSQSLYFVSPSTTDPVTVYWHQENGLVEYAVVYPR